ncbi:hypothetical protein P691DRAFT_686664, partial [Macrolepiota fuliginosa MF-IS2]
QNSPKAKFATVWIDLSNSQQGTCTSTLIGHHLFLNEVEVLIKGAKAHTRTPQCQHCWHWGHTTDMCCCPAVCCPTCAGPHLKAGHCLLMGCCCGKPKANPPVPPTPANMSCPHVHACLNCSAKHAADNHRCPY